jgi:hypothetical protein
LPLARPIPGAGVIDVGAGTLTAHMNRTSACQIPERSGIPRMSINKILILEDDEDRVSRFKASLGALDSSILPVVWRSARKMIREIDEHLPCTQLISLDHDLEPSADDPEDPGDGMEVARFLSAHSPVCPVIIHSSNGQRSDWMMGEFELGGWQFKRVAPIGEAWIEEYWISIVYRLLRRRSRERR